MRGLFALAAAMSITVCYSSHAAASDEIVDQPGIGHSVPHRVGASEDRETRQSEATSIEPSYAPEEVVVTARKINEVAQKAPVTITTMSGADLQARNALDIKDVLGSVPGLSFSGVDRGQSKYSVHGISTSNNLAPTVGVYLDDIALMTNPSVFSGQFDIVFFDMARLEVLKGPQGTLYGGSSMGGAIKYVSARPDLESISGLIAATTEWVTHGSMTYGGEGVINLPLIPGELAFRGGVHFRRDGGYIDNVAGLVTQNTAYSGTAFPDYTPLNQPSRSQVSKEDYNFANTYVLKASLYWQPDPTWQVLSSIFHQSSELAASNYILTNQSGLTSSFRFLDQPNDDTGTIALVEVNKDMAAVRLTSLTGYFERDQVWDRDYSFLIGGLLDRASYDLDSYIHYPQHTRQLSQEVRLGSSSESSSPLKWVVGGFYATTKSRSTIGIMVFGGASVFGTDIAQDLRGKGEVNQYAGFGEASYELFHGFQLSVGMRIFEIGQSSITINAPAIFAPGGNRASAEVTESGSSPKFGLSYQLTNDHLLYATAAKGFRPGGFISSLPVACASELARLGLTDGTIPTAYGSDSLWSYELGSKNSVGSAILNAAVFYSGWRRIQQNFRLTSCGGNLTFNAGAAEVRGAEIEARLEIARELKIGGTATYTEARITDDLLGTLPAKKGNRILDTPEWMASAFAEYSFDLTNSWSLRLRADYQLHGQQRRQYGTSQLVRFPVADGGYSAASPVLDNPMPREAFVQDGYDVLNLSLSLIEGSTLLRLFANNLLDERPWLDTNYTVGISRTTTLRPRTIGLEVRQQF